MKSCLFNLSVSCKPLFAVVVCHPNWVKERFSKKVHASTFLTLEGKPSIENYKNITWTHFFFFFISTTPLIARPLSLKSFLSVDPSVLLQCVDSSTLAGVCVYTCSGPKNGCALLYHLINRFSLGWKRK